MCMLVLHMEYITIWIEQSLSANDYTYRFLNRAIEYLKKYLKTYKISLDFCNNFYYSLATFSALETIFLFAFFIYLFID